MCSSSRYERQLVRILFGCAALVLPFLEMWQIILIVLAAMIGFAYVTDRRSVALGPLHLCFAVLILTVLSWVSNFPVYLLGASIAISTFAVSICETIEADKSPRIRTVMGSAVFLISGMISAFIVGSWIIAFNGIGDIHMSSSPYQFMFFLAVIGTLTGALLESIPHKNNNLTLPFGTAMAMWLFAEFGYWVPPSILIFALALALIIGYISYGAKIADITGVLSGTLLGVLVIVFGGIEWFAVLMVFFVLGGAFTKYEYKYKQSLGIAEAEGGARGYKNVFGNGLVAMILAVAWGVFGWHVFLIGYLGAIATATGDTLASEIGETWRGKPRMITTFEKVKPGTSGAISALGEFSALLGAGVIGIIAVLLGLIDYPIALITTILGGFIGTNVDSLLGATLENRGLLTNHSVNLLATAAGAIVSVGLYWVLV